jgi:arabinofuranan 3-O-arabinosyltransferase
MNDWAGTLRRYSTQLSVAVLALLAYLPALMSSPGRMPGDTKLYLYLDPGRLAADAPWTFDRRQFAGWVPHQQITYLWPSGPWYWFWETVGVPDWVAHRLWLGTIFLVAGLGVRWLARTLGIGVAGALVAAVVYQLSPYILPYVSRTSLMLLPWAALGWIVALTARAATRSRWRDAAILALIIATAGSPNATALAMVAPAPVLWLIHAAWGHTITWRRAVVTAARIGVLAIGVSLWWIAMLIVQGREGADVLAYSESLEAVSFTSNASEVLRGLGYWLFYLRDAYAATTSASWDYLSSTSLIAIGYVLVAVCLLGMVATRWAHRRYALLLFVAGMLLGVGVHPLDDPAPITDWLVNDTSSGLALALRSSTRAVPMATLGLALGAGALVASARPRRSWVRALVPVTIAVLAVLNLPSLWRHDYVDPALERDQDPPAAWLEAAAALDAGDPGYRVLQVPGQEFGAYRWGYTVDQPLPGLTDRPLVTRDLLPLGSPQAMDLLYALDDRFQDGVLEPQAIAPIARMFGADTLWVTNDTAFERFRTPRPEPLTSTFSTPPDGLGEPVPFGDPFVSDPDIDMVDEEVVTSPDIGSPVAPVLLVTVEDPIPVVRAKTRQAVVSGNGDGIVDAAASGLLAGTELVRYSADLTDAVDEQFARLADLLIVTDTNRDRARRWNGSQDNVGFTETGGPDTDLLREESADARIPAFDTDAAATQTTARQEGPVTAIATAYGEPFAYRPEDRAAMAIDGRTDTAWRVADRSDDVLGQRIRLEVAEAVDHVVLTQPATAPRERHITAIDLTVGDRPAQRIELDPTVMTTGQRVEFTTTDGPTTITLTVAGVESPTPVAGPALAAVGFAEIDVGLGPTIEVVAPPSDLLDRIDRPGAPLSVVLTRLRHDATNRYRSDPEPSMVRELALAAPLVSTPEVTARLHPRASDAVLADLFGVEVPVASERVAGDPRSGGWATVDGDPATSWITPFAFVQGARLDVPVPDGEPVRSFTITQPTSDEFNTITAVRVVAGADDWILPVPDPDAEGTSTIALPESVITDELSLIIAEIEQQVVIDRRYAEPVYLPAAISEISIGPRVQLPPALDLGCRDDLLVLDDEPVSIRLSGDTDDLLDGEPFTATPCGGRAQRRLRAGNHRLVSAYGADTGIDIDRVVMSSPTAAAASSARPGLRPAVLTSQSRTAARITVGPCPRGCWLVFGEGYSTSWSASQGDIDLGAPTRVDGGFNGWWIEPTREPVEVTVAWTAQGPVTLGLIVSLVTIAAALALIVVDRRRLAPVPARPVDEGLVALGRPATATVAVVAAIAGVATAALFIEPIAAAWLAAVGALVVATRRLRVAGYAAVAVTLYVGAAVARIVDRDDPYPNGAWLEHITWLHPIALGVVALSMMAAVGARDTDDSS